MGGEGFALLAALGYGLAGVSIVKGKTSARGDNGVFLSVMLTAAVSGLLWLGWGQVTVAILATSAAVEPVAVFIAAGLFSTVLGRTTMYRATEQIGPVAASLLRRLTPVFALPIGVIFLSEISEGQTILGAGLVIAAVMIYIGKPVPHSGPNSGQTIRLGWLLGIGSAAFYAVSYVLRSHGLDHLPDAAFGTFIGAIAGLIWLLGINIFGANPRVRLRKLLLDLGPWHWLTALALSAGQILQFFALKSASVSISQIQTFQVGLMSIIFLLNRIAQVRIGFVWKRYTAQLTVHMVVASRGEIRHLESQMLENLPNTDLAA